MTSHYRTQQVKLFLEQTLVALIEGRRLWMVSLASRSRSKKAINLFWWSCDHKKKKVVDFYIIGSNVEVVDFYPILYFTSHHACETLLLSFTEVSSPMEESFFFFLGPGALNASMLQRRLLSPAGRDGGPDRGQHQTVVGLRGEGQGKHPAGRDVPEESTQGTTLISGKTALMWNSNWM